MTTSIFDPNGNYMGGLALEYSGNGSKKKAEQSLIRSLTGMIKRRGFGNIKEKINLYKINYTDTGYKFLPGNIFEYENLDIKDECGSVIVAICFISYN
jgi:hypothetical protein